MKCNCDHQQTQPSIADSSSPVSTLWCENSISDSYHNPRWNGWEMCCVRHGWSFVAVCGREGKESFNSTWHFSILFERISACYFFLSFFRRRLLLPSTSTAMSWYYSHSMTLRIPMCFLTFFYSINFHPQIIINQITILALPTHICISLINNSFPWSVIGFFPYFAFCFGIDIWTCY